MRQRAGAAIWIAALLTATATIAWAAPPDDARASPGSGRLLDVPFLPQTEDLCGGAAVAMVLRYWGAAEVHPDDFANLVDRTRAGIPANVLAGDVRRRGWQALAFQATAGEGRPWVSGHVDAGRPLIALIAVGPARYHYVVVVAATAEAVVVHDPARAPFRVVPHQEFDRAWAASGRWALVILPGSSPTEPPALVASPRVDAVTEASPPAAASAATSGACTPLVSEMVARAKAGDLTAAATGLELAAALCPTTAEAWRELAGVRFLQSRWGEAVSLAARATTLEPFDEHGWDLLATSQFLDGRPREALASWARIGRPQVDVVRVTGARRTRQPVVVGTLSLAPRSLLTPEAFDHAARRLDALPAALLTELRYRPAAGGLAEVEAMVVERPVVPRGGLAAAATLARLAIHREARLEVASPTGSGELWSAAWRWWEHRPRVSFALAVPAVAGLPGVVSVEGLWERASYAVAPGAGDRAVVQQERRRAGVSVADWATSRLRWSAGAAIDRWSDDAFASLDAAVDVRLAGDRVAVGGEAAAWASAAGRRQRFARTALSLAARTHTSAVRPGWQLSAGLAQVTPGAPFDLWPGAGLGLARPPLLRAHPLLDDGIVTGAAFGRRLIHGTLEYRHPVATMAGGAIGLALFADGARAWHRTTTGSAWHTDAGLGLRGALPGDAGTLRLDVARGLRDRRLVISAGWSTAWPAR